MKTYKRLSKAATMSLFAAGMLGVGGIASIAGQSFAQAPTATNTVVPSSHERGVDTEVNAVLPTGGIAEAAARTAIAAKYPTLTIVRMQLGDNDGKVEYNAKLSDNTEVAVDAMTGAVIPETDAQEGVEHQDKGTDVAGDAKDANETAEVPGTETNDGPNTAKDTETNDGPDGPTDVSAPQAQ